MWLETFGREHPPSLFWHGMALLRLSVTAAQMDLLDGSVHLLKVRSVARLHLSGGIS